MATEILVNDGGAPARILPFTAGSTLSAGDPCQLTSGDEEVDAGTVSGARCLGVALTAATSGNVCNLISGRGVVLYVNCSGTIAAGDDVEMAGNGAMQDSKAVGNSVGIALEDNTSGPNLKKVLLL